MTQFVKRHNHEDKDGKPDGLEPPNQPDRIQPLMVPQPDSDQADRRSHDQHDD